MTAIVWCDKTKTLATDSQTTTGSLLSQTKKNKIILVNHSEFAGNKALAFAFAGDVSSEGYVKLLLEKKQVLNTWEHSDVPVSLDFGAIVVTDVGAFSFTSQRGENTATIQDCKEGGFMTMGSCWELLQAVMYMGKTAEEAVNLAIVHDVYCGGEVKVVSFADELGKA